MLNRILEISEENRYISLSRGFVVVKQDNVELGKIPIDDISVLLLTAQGVTVSKNILNTLSENNCITILCGKNYVPSSIVVPISSHYQFTKNLKNQSLVLKLCNKDFQLVEKISSLVKSGDTDNREAYAAKIYWNCLFGKEFRRDKNAEGINSLLNYGYAIIRASMIRVICSAGLLPALGVNHNNNLNQFCLADDFMEIYRPLIDVTVYNLYKNGIVEISPIVKKELINTLWINIHTKEGNSPVFQSMHYLVGSYVHALENKISSIELPIWTGDIDEKSSIE